MPRGLSVVASAALLCGLAYYFLQGMVGSGRALEEIVLATCAAALTLATISAAFSLMALVRANRSDAEFRRLALSVEAALRDFSARSDGDAVTIGEIDASLSRKLDALAASLPPRQARPGANGHARSATILPHPAARLVETGEAAGFDPSRRAAVQRSLASGRITIGLQPIISISQGAAVGHMAVALAESASGEQVELGRADFHLPGIPSASCERLLISAAAAALDRQQGQSGHPLHVAISGALLDDGSEFAAVLTLLGQHPALARALVLSAPAAVIADGQHGQALALLSATGARLAAEDWSGSPEELETLRGRSVSMLKMPAAQLLERASMPQAETLLERAAAAKLPVVATDVSGDGDAVGLIDLGVNLMTGKRFAASPAHGSEAAASAERLAHF